MSDLRSALGNPDWLRDNEEALKPRGPFVPTQEQLLLLGTQSDSALSIAWGVPRHVIRDYRSRKGIPGKGRKFIPTTEQQYLLGKVCDSTLSKAWGVSATTVRIVRLQLGLPRTPYGFLENMTPEQISLLGTESDVSLAKKWGVSKPVVVRARQVHNVISLRKKKGEIWCVTKHIREKEFSKKWRKNNPEKVRELNKAWRSANPDAYRVIRLREQEKKNMRRFNEGLAQLHSLALEYPHNAKLSSDIRSED